MSTDDTPALSSFGGPGDRAWVTSETIEGGPTNAPLFVGDTGTLSEKVREVLVMLLKRRYLSAEEHPRDYAMVLEQEPALRNRLNDQFLDLVIDRRHQVAYKRQALSETGEKFPTLLYDQAYNREETILLYLLRVMLSGSAAGSPSGSDTGIDSVYVDRSDLLAQVERFRPSTATDTVGDANTTNTAISGLVKQGLLLKTAQPDRYRIPTIIRVLLDVHTLQQLRAWLQVTNGAVELPVQLSVAEYDTSESDGDAPGDSSSELGGMTDGTDEMKELA